MSEKEPWKKKVELFRNRFVARQDLFSVRYPYTVKKTDKLTGEVTTTEEATVMPACSNYGDQKVCLIAQRKGGCTECDHRIFTTLTDQEIWRHISGEREMILFMLREEGIRFGAADFDKGNTFEDAKAVRDLSVSYGIPCYIAKSTKKGYHVYWFFQEFVKAHEFTSYIRHLYTELDFYQRYQLNPDVGLPEVFPKQPLFDNTRMGNGIKVPMMEPRMREGRNCWVDDVGTPIPFDQQWVYFEETKLITAEEFDKVLRERRVEILKASASKNTEKARKEENREDGDPLRAPKPFGDFWNVVEGCPAMKEYWGKDDKGRYLWSASLDKTDNLDYQAYLASIMIAVTTTNGTDVVQNRWKDKDTETQINFAVQSRYTPMSCKTMQDRGVCVVGKHPKCGDHCLKKLAPIEYHEGKRVINPDGLAEEQWPEPSPIRFATDRNLDADGIIERLAEIFKLLKTASKKPKSKEEAEEVEEAKIFIHEKPQDRIEGLITRAVAFETTDEREWIRVESAILTNKWMSAKELKATVKRIKKDTSEEKASAIRVNNPTFKFDNAEYRLQNNRYYMTHYDAKGMPVETMLTNFHIQLHEDKISIRINDSEDIHEAVVVEDRTFSSTFHVDGRKTPVNGSHKDVATPDALFKWLTQNAGLSFTYKRHNFDHIRICMYEFSKDTMAVKKISKQVGHHVLKGRNIYITPSVLVDKESIRPNEELLVEPFEHDVARGLDFKMLSSDEFKSLAQHVVTDYFACNNAVLTMTTFAHAMAAAMLPQIQIATGYNKGPVLWLGGSQSGGKTFVAIAAQHFYGNFTSIQNASGSAKSKITNAHDFRHAFMLIDDYKKAYADPFGKEFPQLVQMSYDRSSRTALQRNGVQRTRADRVRGLLAITGEDVIESEASSSSRVILIDVPFCPDHVSGKKVIARRADYCGFTPYIIKFALNLSSEDIAKIWDEYYEYFCEPVREAYKRIGPERICENLTLNMVAFRLTMEALVAEGAIPDVQRDELCRIHKGNLVSIRSTVFSSVGNATGANVFLDSLKELLQNPSKCVVWNWPGYDSSLDLTNKNATQIGFYREKTPDTIYIYPKVAHGLVTEMVKRNNNHTQTITHIARQLYDDGCMIKDRVKRDKSEYCVQIRGPAGSQVRVWPLSIEALGLEPRKGEKAKQRDSDSNLIPLDIASNNHKT